MKSVLILAYDFPPFLSVGSLRPYSWYRYLKEYGIEPIVVTRQWSNDYGNELDYVAPSKSKNIIVDKTEFGTIIQAPFRPNYSNRLLLKYGESRYKFIRKLISGFFHFVQFSFFVGSKSCIYFSARDYLKNHKVDAIIVTGEPFVLFKYASKLSELYNIPWIADYRDTWSQSLFRSRNIFLLKWNQYFEKKYLKNSACITTVSDFTKCQIEKLIQKKYISVLINGYNSDIVINTKIDQQDRSKFNLAFIGNIANYYPISVFFDTLFKFIIDHPDYEININFYGINRPEIIKNEMLKYPVLVNKISIYPKLSNEKLLNHLINNHCLLLFNDYFVSGTKIYDYLAVKRKILFCFTNYLDKDLLHKWYDVEIDKNVKFDSYQVQAKIIEETNSGILVENSEHLYITLQNLYKEFQETGNVKCDSINIEKYSRKVQTQQLAHLIKSIIKIGRASCRERV